MRSYSLINCYLVEPTFILVTVEKMARYKTVALIATVLLAIVMVVLLHSVDVPVDTLQVAVVPGDSIQDAINKAQAGAVILIQNGSYFEESYPIVVNKTVALVGENADATIVDGKGTVQGIFLVRSDGVKIKNLTVRNTVKHSFDVAAVHLANANDVEVTDCILSECAVGIMLKNVSNCVIAGNVIVNNSVEGILMRDNCVSNLIFGNTIANNVNGIRTTDFTCRDNRFYHNNFLNNTYQMSLVGVGGVWDDGHPSGGNYWSDYTGADEKSGPNQDQPGSDGIGDAAYGDGLDRYPSMEPLRSFDAGQ